MRGLDLLNEIADRVGTPQMSTIENPELTPEQRKLIRLMNRVLKNLGHIFPWPMLREEATIVLLASETSDTTTGSEEYVIATQNSDTITVQNATFDSTYKGRAIWISGDEYVYRIEQVLSATSLKLNRIWISDTIDATDERTYTIAMDQYALPTDFDRPADDMESFFSPSSIGPLSGLEFRKYRKRDGTQSLGDPAKYTVSGMNDSQTAQLLHFHPYPEFARLLYYAYQKIHQTIDTDNDKVLYPEGPMNVVIDTMIWLWSRDHEDDQKVQEMMIDAMKSYNQHLANPTVTGPKWIMQPANLPRQDIRNSLRRGSNRWDYGDHFDKFQV